MALLKCSCKCTLIMIKELKACLLEPRIVNSFTSVIAEYLTSLQTFYTIANGQSGEK